MNTKRTSHKDAKAGLTYNFNKELIKNLEKEIVEKNSEIQNLYGKIEVYKQELEKQRTGYLMEEAMVKELCNLFPEDDIDCELENFDVVHILKEKGKAVGKIVWQLDGYESSLEESETSTSKMETGFGREGVLVIMVTSPVYMDGRLIKAYRNAIHVDRDAIKVAAALIRNRMMKNYDVHKNMATIGQVNLVLDYVRSEIFHDEVANIFHTLHRIEEENNREKEFLEKSIARQKTTIDYLLKTLVSASQLPESNGMVEDFSSVVTDSLN